MQKHYSVTVTASNVCHWRFVETDLFYINCILRILYFIEVISVNLFSAFICKHLYVYILCHVVVLKSIYLR